MKVLIWGTGENARKYLDKKEITGKEIVGFIESKPTSSELLYGGGIQYIARLILKI